MSDTENEIGKLCCEEAMKLEGSDPSSLLIRASNQIFKLQHELSNQWLPIASAPKDLIRIIVGGGTYSHCDMNCEFYDTPFKRTACVYWSDRRGEWFDGDCEQYKPTHWQPLPKPPKPAEPFGID